MKDIKVIGFDADDTLWMCEPIFRNAEKEMAAMLSPWIDEDILLERILADHVANIPMYGYGIKGYILSIVETVLDLGKGEVPHEVLNKIIAIGKRMLNEPVSLLKDVEQVLPKLKGKYKLVVATKGDLLDQQRKLNASGLSQYFDEVEIMSDKKPENYRRMFNRLNIKPSEFVMVGNSLKSDILPVIELGAYGVHIPYHITWAHEIVESVDRYHPGFREIEHLDELIDMLEIE